MTAGALIRIVADDLTGALDAAAPFARPGRPAGLVLHPTQIPDRAALTISTESRDNPVADAMAATARACALLRGAPGAESPLWFHKIDSVLRGHPYATTAEMLRCLDLPHCIFAPAFPAMGRITAGGHHRMWDGTGWQPTPQSDILAGLAAAGLRAVGLTSTPSAATDQGPARAVVVDAATQDDLDRAAARLRGERALWVGSRALAESLAGPVVPLRCPPVALVVVGTSHPATRAQAARARPVLAEAPGTGPISAPPGQCQIIDPVPDSADAAATRAALAEAARRIDPAGLHGRCMIVSGGESLSVVLAAIGARSLDCLGEIGPGLPLAMVRGGLLDGCCLITKSGGFGAPDLMLRLIAANGLPARP